MQLLSSRSKAILSSPVFFRENLPAKFEVILDSSDRILTLVHSYGAQSVEFILAEVLCLFAEKKSALQIWDIKMREIESFLRDENHIPAFGEELLLIENLWKEVRAMALALVIKKKLNSALPKLLMEAHGWAGLSLVAKNHWAKTLLSPLGIELILCEAETLTIKMPPRNIELEELESTLLGILGEGRKVLPVKLVAV